MWYLAIILVFIFATALYPEYRERRYHDDYDEEEHDGQDNFLPYHKNITYFLSPKKDFMIL